MNIFIGAILLWFASKVFPNIVQISDPTTLIIAILLMGLAALFISGFALLFAFFGIITLDINSFIISIIAYMCANLIAVYLICDYLPGFNIVGFWPKLLVSLVFTNFRIDTTSNRS